MVLQLGSLKLTDSTIMIDTEFLCNRNINEANSLPDLMHSLNPDSESEINIFELSCLLMTKSLSRA